MTGIRFRFKKIKYNHLNYNSLINKLAFLICNVVNNYQYVDRGHQFQEEEQYANKYDILEY